MSWADWALLIAGLWGFALILTPAILHGSPQRFDRAREEAAKLRGEGPSKILVISNHGEMIK